MQKDNLISIGSLAFNFLVIFFISLPVKSEVSIEKGILSDDISYIKSHEVDKNGNVIGINLYMIFLTPNFKDGICYRKRLVIEPKVDGIIDETNMYHPGVTIKSKCKDDIEFAVMSAYRTPEIRELEMYSEALQEIKSKCHFKVEDSNDVVDLCSMDLQDIHYHRKRKSITFIYFDPINIKSYSFNIDDLDVNKGRLYVLVA